MSALKPYSDDRESLAQELRECFRSRGLWCPETSGPDLIMRVAMAAEREAAATAMREALETAAQEMDLLAEIGPGDLEMARVRWDVLSKWFRAALALDGGKG